MVISAAHEGRHRPAVLESGRRCARREVVDAVPCAVVASDELAQRIGN
jgi:hypothetical protein